MAAKINERANTAEWNDESIVKAKACTEGYMS